jgi:hypothetical protein
VSVGIGGSQKVDLRSPRPALIYVYRSAAALPFTAQAQESVRRVAVLMSTTPDEPESQALQSGTSLNSFSLVRVVMGQSSGGACSPLMRRGVFSVNFALWGAPREEFLDMCDYSLHSVRTRPAKVGEKLVTHNFGTGTRGFAAPEDCSVAVCVLPGTELAFETPVKYQTILMLRANTGHTVAIFRQINKGALHINHDALEFPDGEIVLLTRLYEGQKATVLTLPTQPKTAAEAEAQQRVAYVG